MYVYIYIYIYMTPAYPSTRPQTGFFWTNLKNHGREVNEEESYRRKHHWYQNCVLSSWNNEIDGVESWRRKQCSKTWEASERHLRGIWDLEGIWESSERHLRGIWEAFGRHLGGIWETFGRHLGCIWADLAHKRGRQREIDRRAIYHWKNNVFWQKFPESSISRGVFEGTINYDCIFTATYDGWQRNGNG